jgi:hypothetical protein
VAMRWDNDKSDLHCRSFPVEEMERASQSQELAHISVKVSWKCRLVL